MYLYGVVVEYYCACLQSKRTLVRFQPTLPTLFKDTKMKLWIDRIKALIVLADLYNYRIKTNQTRAQEWKHLMVAEREKKIEEAERDYQKAQDETTNALA